MIALFIRAASGAAPLEAYGHLPSIANPCLSPDGSRLAFVHAIGDERFIVVRSIVAQKSEIRLPMTEQKVRSVEWADADHLLVVISKKWGLRDYASELGKLYVYDLVSKKWTLVPDDVTLSNFPDRLRGTFELSNWIAGPAAIRRVAGHTHIFIRAYVRASQKLWQLGFARPFQALMEPNVDRSRPMAGLVQIDLTEGSAKLVRLGAESNLRWLIDEEGNVVAEQTYSEAERRWSLLVAHEGHLEDVAGGSASIDFPHLVGFGRTVDTLLLTSGNPGDIGWRLVSVKGKAAASSPDFPAFEVPIKDRLTERLIGGARFEGRMHYVFLDDNVQAKWHSVIEAFGDGQVRFVSSDDHFRKLLVLLDDPKYGYRYEFVDTDTHWREPVGNVYDRIDDALEVRTVNYVARDNLSIPAYLTLPRDRPGTKLALVVLVHGGPAYRDTAEFDWWSQALAEQGYAVLRTNFRGSTVNQQLFLAGFGEFGRKMQTDLSDGVRYLIREGIVDPARVCIAGGSYGGYASLAAAALESGIYRCAVSVAGISDLKSMLRWINDKQEDSDSREQRYWDRFMGVSGPDDPELEQISPIKHVDSVNVPVLLIHGRDDTVVPYGQSEKMYDALRHAGKTVELVELKHEDHWLSRSETRLQMLQATVAFLRKNNPPD